MPEIAHLGGITVRYPNYHGLLFLTYRRSDSILRTWKMSEHLNPSLKLTLEIRDLIFFKDFYGKGFYRFHKSVKTTNPLLSVANRLQAT